MTNFFACASQEYLEYKNLNPNTLTIVIMKAYIKLTTKYLKLSNTSISYPEEIKLITRIKADVIIDKIAYLTMA